MTTPAAAPVLVARDARIAIDGVVALAGLDFETRGDRVALVGHARPLLLALSRLPGNLGAAAQLAEEEDPPPYAGFAAVAGGSLALRGHDVRVGAHLPHVGVAPLDAPTVPSWTALEHVGHWARVGLAHKGERCGKREVAAAAHDALDRAGLGHAKRRQVKALSVPERRVLWIASAMASRPAVVIVDRPTEGLTGQAAEYVSGALVAAEDGRALIVALGQLTPGTPDGALARRASDVLVFAGDALVAAGGPGEVLGDKRLYRVRVHDNGPALAELLAQRGAQVSGGPHHFAVGLPEGEGPSAVLRAAHEVRSAVVEILPLM